MPSKSEVFELIYKADQKISGFEVAINNAKPTLDLIDDKLAKNYLDAASAAHFMIKHSTKNGPSAYALVGLLATMDDLSLDAANASVQLLSLKSTRRQQVNSAAEVGLLSNSGTACNDISELIMHAILRFVQTEEQVLNKLLETK